MKTVLVTGGGRGLGRATAEKVAVAGHRVILVARTQKAAATAAGEIRRDHPGAFVEPRSVDLSSMSEVRAFAALELERREAIDVLFHVAGVMQQSATRRVTVDGYEETLAVKCWRRSCSPACCFRRSNCRLRPGLSPSALGSTCPVRAGIGPLRLCRPQLEHGYHPDRAYKNSKLAVLWFTYELQRRLPPRAITANSVCPGFVPATRPPARAVRCAS